MGPVRGAQLRSQARFSKATTDGSTWSVLSNSIRARSRSDQASFFEGHPTPCSIKVNHQDVVCGPHGVGPNKGCPGLPAKARGVWGDGMDVDHWGAADGDSGATIFVERTGGRDYQARGVLSDGDKGDGAPGVFWVEAPDIFNHFGLTLNTVT